MNNYLTSTFKIVFSALFLVVAVSSISACGQRGNLYLPAEKAEEVNAQLNTKTKNP